MAVVVSQGQNEIADMAAKGLDIVPHRTRMVKTDLEEQFKNPDSPLRIVFVCAMWITGFDVPSCSTIYLDKPMRNHTLMQTIARANRVAPGKTAGLIVDYVGVFRSLQKALAIYAAPTDGGSGDDEPIKDKSALVELLKQALADADAHCMTHGVTLANIEAAEGYARIGLLDDAVEALIRSDEEKKQFMQLASQAAKLFKAILPDPQASELAPRAVLLSVIAEKIRALTPPADISEVMGEVETLLDASIATEGYVIREPSEKYDTSAGFVDLSKIDFEALQAKFSAGRKRTEAEKLRNLISQKLDCMVKLNRSRADYLERFQKLIDEYNSGSKNIEAFFEELKKFRARFERGRSTRRGRGFERRRVGDFRFADAARPEADQKRRSRSEEGSPKFTGNIEKRKTGARLAGTATITSCGSTGNRNNTRHASRGLHGRHLRTKMRSNLSPCV